MLTKKPEVESERFSWGGPLSRSSPPRDTPSFHPFSTRLRDPRERRLNSHSAPPSPLSSPGVAPANGPLFFSRAVSFSSLPGSGARPNAGSGRIQPPPATLDGACHLSERLG